MDNYDYHLIVPGKPRPQGRPRAASRGKFITIYEHSIDTKAKKHIKLYAKLHEPDKIFDCPLRVDLVFHMPRPQEHYRAGKFVGDVKLRFTTKLHTSKPDLDNLAKLTLDALTGILWVDDSCVCESYIKKVYANEPMTEVFVKVLTEPEPGQGPLFDDVNQKDNSDSPSEIYI